MKKKILKVNGKSYTPFYKFEGGEYFVLKDAVSSEAWMALMDDGSLQILVDGVQRPYDAEYELVDAPEICI